MEGEQGTDVDQWIQKLEAACKDGSAPGASASGFNKFRRAATQRSIKAGSAPGWDKTRRLLQQWSSSWKVLEHIQLAGVVEGERAEYSAPELLEPNQLAAEAEARGVDEETQAGPRTGLIAAVNEAHVTFLEENHEASAVDIAGDSQLQLSQPLRAAPTDGAGWPIRPECGVYTTSHPWLTAEGAVESLAGSLKVLAGRTLLMVQSLSKPDRPTWLGLQQEPTKLVVSVLYGGVVGSSESRTDLEILLMETLLPFKLHRFKVDQVVVGEAVRQVGAAADAFAVSETTGEKEFLFILQEDFVVDPLMVESYPQIAVRQDGSAAMERPRQAKSDFSTLKEVIGSIGSGGAFREVAEDEDFMKQMMSLSVKGSMSNVTVASKQGRTLPELSGLKMGGKDVHPTDKTLKVAESTTITARRKLTAQLGRDGVGFETSHKWCFECNLPLLLEIFMESVEEIRVKFEQHGLVMTPETWKRFSFESPDAWFCSVHGGGKLLVLGGKSAIVLCPGKGCSNLLKVPWGGIVSSCTRCPIVFGVRAVKASEIDLSKFELDTPAWSGIETTRGMVYEYLRLQGGAAQISSASGFKGVQKVLLEQMANPTKAHSAGFPLRHQRTSRHAAFSPAWVWKMDGGLDGSDYQLLSLIHI
eukprot:TRINITY_DN5477_c0_g1_i2.p1 TRINITY_DN5477_c0_g1~~TRINITY_DN5477_c0_g1_i2.p1  ORF type:complete len:642 (-),score=121.85 TRINITY_DN5477_c0_g1_i2:124-2049(-)